jgi:hypothetical protein
MADNEKSQKGEVYIEKDSSSHAWAWVLVTIIVLLLLFFIFGGGNLLGGTSNTTNIQAPAGSSSGTGQ